MSFGSVAEANIECNRRDRQFAINNSDDEVTGIAGLDDRRSAMTLAAEKTSAVEGARIPDSRLAREITELVRDTESALLFHHSNRVYFGSALAGKRRALKFDRELLYAGAMFHDMG
jgi:hypothetical protein